MTENNLSPEMLAALLDGRLSPVERERVLATLARSDEAYDDFIEALAVTTELENAGTTDIGKTSIVRPLRPKSRWRPALMIAMPAILAASVLIIARTREPASNAAAIAAGDDITSVVRSPLAAAGATTAGKTTWSDVRGSGIELRPSARLFRMGVRYAELEAAYSSADAAAADSAFIALRDAASATTDGRLEVLALQTAQTTPAPADRVALATRLRSLENDTWPGWFDLGAWCASARFAAAAKEVAFFAPDGDALRALNRLLAEEQQLTPAQRQQAPEALPSSLRTLAAQRITSDGQLAAVTALLRQAILTGSR